MSLRKLKLFKIIQTGSTEQILKGLMDYLKSGKDPNIRDETNGGTLLHLIVEHGDKFTTGQTVSGVYMLVCKDIDIDAQDNKGETGLHKAVRIPGAFRIIMALMRCGADTTITNTDGRTAEEVMHNERPPGWEENLHWYNKFKPGLWVALDCEEPDRRLVENLLRHWCRVITVKKGKVTNMKTLVKDDIHKVDLLRMIEKYENTNELALATTAGMGFIVRMWVREGIINESNIDVNTKDHSYQFNYTGYPSAPRPLVAASWESSNLSAVDVIMDLKPDTRVLWSPDNEAKNPPKPVFFQLFCGSGAPYDERIVHRVLSGSDLSARDNHGNTILHVAIETNQTEATVKVLLNNGVDIAARDSQGRTARDIAERLKSPKYTKLIDDFVIKLVKDKKLEPVEGLILHNYDHVLDVADGQKRLVDIAKKHSTRNLYEIVKLTPALQAYVQRVFQAIDDGSLDDFRRLLSCKRYGDIRDRCGRSVLHRTILKQQRDMMQFILDEFPALVNSRDSMDRTPLHYAHLFMEDPEVIQQFTKAGADPKLIDAFGRTGRDHSRDVCGNQQYARLQKELREFSLNVFLSESDFETTFKRAIKSGDIDTIKCLVRDLRNFGDVNRYSSTLFDCLDSRELDIARFLINNGFDTDIYKQYNMCDPNDPMCSMMECGHTMTSLRERAEELKLDDISHLIDAATNGELKQHVEAEAEVSLPSYGIF